VDRDGRRCFRGKACTVPLPLDAAQAAEGAPDGEVVLGIRPEDVVLFDASDALRGRVFVAEPLGANVLVTVDLDGELVKSRVAAPFRTSIDSTVGVLFDPAWVHLFAAADGTALHSPTTD
jgi:multiple sugar transport system ATP-binding protein